MVDLRGQQTRRRPGAAGLARRGTELSESQADKVTAKLLEVQSTGSQRRGTPEIKTNTASPGNGGLPAERIAEGHTHAGHTGWASLGLSWAGQATVHRTRGTERSSQAGCG